MQNIITDVIGIDEEIELGETEGLPNSFTAESWSSTLTESGGPLVLRDLHVLS